MSKKDNTKYTSKSAYLEAVSKKPSKTPTSSKKATQKEGWKKLGDKAALAAVQFAESKSKRK